MKGSIVAALLAFSLAGCTAHVIPPSGLTAPVSVYVLNHGRHSSLVLPGESGWRRYAYGDWQWYAENRTGLMQGAAALVERLDALGGCRRPFQRLALP